MNMHQPTKRANKFKTLGLGLLLSGLCFTLQASAQDTPPPPAVTQQAPQVKTDFPDSLIEHFVDINIKLQPLQQSSEKEMEASITSSGMTVERFSEIMSHRQQGQNDSLSAEEDATFKKAAQSLMAQQEKASTAMVAIIQKEGMEPQTFQQIAMAYQSSPSFQEKINKLIQAKAPKATADSPAKP